MTLGAIPRGPGFNSQSAHSFSALVAIISYTMQVNATFAGQNTWVGNSFRQEWKAGMRGHCYGCGNSCHAKAQCPHRQSLCSWCGRPGHLDKVCFQQAAGKPKAANPQGAPTVAWLNNPFTARATATNPFQPGPATNPPVAPHSSDIQESLQQLRRCRP
jgi:hypothetical protein